MVVRTKDWFRQAEKDLVHAKKDLSGKDFEWACFSSHQAAEKAVKALFQSLHIEVWGHSVSKMLENLPESLSVPRELIDKAKELDRHYIPTRYPNFHSEGAPMDYYTENDARRAIGYAEEIIGFVRSKIPKDELR